MDPVVVALAFPAVFLLLGCFIMLVVIAVHLGGLLELAQWAADEWCGDGDDPGEGEPVVEEPKVVRLIGRRKAA